MLDVAQTSPPPVCDGYAPFVLDFTVREAIARGVTLDAINEALSEGATIAMLATIQPDEPS